MGELRRSLANAFGNSPALSEIECKERGRKLLGVSPKLWRSASSRRKLFDPGELFAAFEKVVPVLRKDSVSLEWREKVIAFYEEVSGTSHEEKFTC